MKNDSVASREKSWPWDRELPTTVRKSDSNTDCHPCGIATRPLSFFNSP